MIENLRISIDAGGYATLVTGERDGAPDSDLIASVWNDDYLALLAAAPELLDALVNFDNWFAGFNPDDQHSRMQGRKVVIAAREAIAKARGQ